jgi:hypothetical protein
MFDFWFVELLESGKMLLYQSVLCAVNRELRNKANREELIKYVLSDEHHQGVAKDTVLPGDV